MDSVWMANGSSRSIPRPRGSVRRRAALGRAHPGSVFAGNAGQRHRRHRLLPRLLVPPRFRRAATASPASACCCTSARSITPPRSGSTAHLVAEHEGGYTPFYRRHHGFPGSEARAADPWWCAPRTIPPTSPSRAASRTGSSSRTPSGIRAPPASGRPSGWSACPPPASAACAGRPTWSAGRSASRRWLDGERRDDLRLNVKLLRRRHACWPTTPTRWSPARSTGASRFPTPASTTTATSCSGAPPRPPSSRPS